MIISTTQEKVWLNRIAVKSNNFATFLMDQNWFPCSVIWASINPIPIKKINKEKIYQAELSALIAWQGTFFFKETSWSDWKVDKPAA